MAKKRKTIVLVAIRNALILGLLVILATDGSITAVSVSLSRMHPVTPSNSIVLIAWQPELVLTT